MYHVMVESAMLVALDNILSLEIENYITYLTDSLRNSNLDGRRSPSPAALRCNIPHLVIVFPRVGHFLALPSLQAIISLHERLPRFAEAPVPCEVPRELPFAIRTHYSHNCRQKKDDTYQEPQTHE